MQFVLLIGAVLALSPSIDERKVALLPIESSGTATPARLQAGLEEAMSVARVAFVAGVRVAEVVGADPRCRSAQCLESVATELRAHYALRTTVSARDAVWDVTMELVAVDGALVARARDTCEICGVEEVAQLLRDRAATLMGKLDQLDARPPELSVRTEPPGAQVWIDGRAVGLSPVREQVTIGPHVVEVELAGRVRQRREIEALVGMEMPIHIALAVDPSHAPRRDRRHVVAGGVLLGAGAMLAGAGVALLAIDGREYRRECNPDARGACSHLHETTAGGATLVATGIVAAVAGSVLMGLARKKRPREVAATWGLRWQ